VQFWIWSRQRKSPTRSYPLEISWCFPAPRLTLEVGRTRSVKAVEMARSSDMRIAMCTQKDNDVVDPLPENISEVGTLGLIKEISRRPHKDTTGS
jgi:ATP-dependent Lon protease